ncbi:MAG: hypothetical protein R3B96_23415 [Pirellulaceae bacterium]
MFQGEEWQRNQDFVDELRPRQGTETERDRSRDQLDDSTRRHQRLFVAPKRNYQIRESALAMRWRLSQDQIAQIDQAIERRGPISTRAGRVGKTAVPLTLLRDQRTERGGGP